VCGCCGEATGSEEVPTWADEAECVGAEPVVVVVAGCEEKVGEWLREGAADDEAAAADGVGTTDAEG
jgi:hypothetical protein